MYGLKEDMFRCMVNIFIFTYIFLNLLNNFCTINLNIENILYLPTYLIMKIYLFENEIWLIEVSTVH